MADRSEKHLPTDDELVDHALASLPEGTPSPGLADRAFAAAMAEGSLDSSDSSGSLFADLLEEVLALSRIAAGASVAVAVVLVFIALQVPFDDSRSGRIAASGSADQATAYEATAYEDLWTRAALPISLADDAEQATP